MIFGKMKAVLKKIIYKLAINHRRKEVIRCGLNCIVPVEKLTDKELKQVNKIWGGIERVGRKSSRFYELIKTYGSFSPLCVSEDMFNAYIVRSLNNPANAVGYEHKGMYQMLFSGLKQPKVYINCINGSFYDGDYNLLSDKEAQRVLTSLDNNVVIKPTIFSNQGKGVRIFETVNIPALKDIRVEYGENFIIQSVLKQSPETKFFSKKSLNSFRISTLFINGECSVCTILFRCGIGDSFVDNGYAGNLMIGVTEDGKLQNYAYDKWYNKHDKSDTGIVFKNHMIKNVDKLVEFAKYNHVHRLPHCGFVGWDLALDVDNEPVLIEINLFSPGVCFEQLAPDLPLFGKRTLEVIDYVRNHKPSLNSVMMNLGY